MISRLQFTPINLTRQPIMWLLFLLMGVARLAQAQCPANKPLPGNVTLTSQAQVDALVGAFPNGCTSLGGTLTISGTDITNLNGLNGLSFISGALVITTNPQLTDITGLTALTGTQYGVKISGNDLLTKLDGLNKLRSVGGNLELTNNPQLASLAALTALTTVSLDLIVSNNAVLPTLNGLNNLRSIASLQLTKNPQLTSIAGLTALTRADGGLLIQGNAVLSTLEGLTNLQKMVSLQLTNNPQLTRITGLTSLTSVLAYVWINSNASLTTLEGLTSLQSVGGDLQLIGNPKLTSIAALTALTSLGKDLQIGYNTVLSSLTGLNKLQSIKGNLLLVANPQLTSIDALTALTSVGSLLRLNSNSQLTSLAGLTNLQQVGGSLEITSNPVLSVCAFPAICQLIATKSPDQLTVSANAPGCSSVQDIQADCSPLVITTQPPAESAVCPGGAVTAAVSITGNARAYQWYKGDQPVAGQTTTTLSLTNVQVGDTGTYQLVVSNSVRSLTATAFALTVNALPVVSLSGLASAYCPDAPAQILSATPTGGVLTIDGVNATSVNPASLSVGQHTVVYTYTNTSGCAASASQSLTINALPIVSISPSATAICAGQQASLAASDGPASYRWSTGQTSQSISVSLTGTYALTATNASGCSSSATATLTVNPLPVISITPSATAICQDQTATFTASGASAYQWRGPNGLASTSPAVSGSLTGSYSVTAIDAQGCSASASASLTVNPLPSPPSLKTPVSQPGQLYPAGSNNVTLPQYSGTVTLLGGGCAGGTVRWSGPGNTSGTGDISVATTQTGTFVYQAICQVGQCTSTPTSATVTVIKDKLRVVAPLFNCATNKLTLRTTGGNGKPVEYHIASITEGWSSANPVSVSSRDFRRDFDIDARQKESDNTGYDKAQELDDYKLPACGGRLATQETMVELPLSVAVLGNPVQGGELLVEIRGAEGQPLQLTLTDSQGRAIAAQQLPRAEAVEQRTFAVGSQPAGLLLLQVSTPSQRQSVKVLRMD